MKAKILELIKNNDMAELKNILSISEEMEILHAYYDLSEKEQVIVFRLLTKSVALSIFEHLDTDEQENLILSFTNESATEFVNNMAPDDRVKLLDELPASIAKKLIESISKEERDATNILLGYKEETAGRIMTTEFISLNQYMTIEKALEKISIQANEKETIYTLFVTDEQKRLEGILTLKEILISRGLNSNKISNSEILIRDIMSKNIISVSVDTDQEEVVNILRELDLLAIPVVDKESKIVGIVTIDDAIDILEEEVTEDILDQAGFVEVSGSESDRSEILVKGSMWKIWRVRLPFLFITLVAAMFAGGIIESFEETLESIAVVAIFIPLIMDMGGNVGTQSSTVFARGVVLGHINVKKFLKPFLKEIGIGFSMGLFVGLIAGAITIIWQGIPMLGVAVGLSLLVTMTLAALLGFLVPFILIKFNVDQAAGSAPIITSIKDIAGLVIYFIFITTFVGNML